MIQVYGEIQTGQDPVSASYSIDGESPTSQSEIGVDQNSTLVSQVLYSSPDLTLGSHELNITVLNTGKNRQYKPWFFAVHNTVQPSQTSGVSPSSTGTNDSSNASNTSHGGHTDVGAIVAGVLGGLLLVTIVIFGILYFRKRRATRGLFVAIHRALAFVWLTIRMQISTLDLEWMMACLSLNKVS